MMNNNNNNNNMLTPGGGKQPPLGPTTTIILMPDEFKYDAENNLGRANGNTYQRKPALPGVHDGQIMVRLKKKRFIIIDYSYVPNMQDMQYARSFPHIVIPEGAGTQNCSTRNCPNVGVPCQLFDSHPAEPLSLYLRGGLCFSCQRNLNEKRRTQRKRKSDGLPVGTEGHSGDASVGSNSHGSSRFKINNEYVDLNPDAIIINGPIEGTRTRGPDYQTPQIGSDILQIVSDLTQEATTLMTHSANVQAHGTAGAIASTATINDLYQRTFLSLSKATFLITQWKASWDENIANKVAAASHASFVAGSSLQPHHHAGMDGLLNEAIASTAAFGGSATMDSLMMPSGNGMSHLHHAHLQHINQQYQNQMMQEHAEDETEDYTEV
jgi:hypothetical protein